MKWWIEQTNRDWQSGHLAKDSDKVAALQRQKFVQRFLTRTDALRKNHLSHRRQPLIAKKHVFCTTEPNSFGTKLSGGFGVQRCVGVSSDAELAKLIRPRHQLIEVTLECWLDCWNLPEKDSSGRDVDGDPVALGNYSALN